MDSDATHSWEPTLHGELAERAADAVDAIGLALHSQDLEAAVRSAVNAHSIAHHGVSPSYGQALAQIASLCSGASGIALFFAHLGASRESEKHLAKARECLELAESAVMRSSNMPTDLYGGLAGIGFAFAYLDSNESSPELLTSDDASASELLAVIDRRILDSMQDPDAAPVYDLISGVVGLGVYALVRWPDRRAREILEGALDRLESWSHRPREGQLAWHTPASLLPPGQRVLVPNGYWNLGLAHGVPGIVSVLGRIAGIGLSERAMPLLEPAISWLLQQRLPEDAESAFPPWVADVMSPTNCRSAWCYGDPGVAISLLVAARSVNRPDWEAAAVEIALKSAQRPASRAGVVDAGLCHGAAGLGHIYARLYNATGMADFAYASREWFCRALTFRSGVGQMPPAAAQTPVIEEPGLLTGDAGIGLALLAGTHRIEPSWDLALLCSVPEKNGNARRELRDMEAPSRG